MCVLMRFSHAFKLDNEHEWMIEFYHIGFSALIEKKKKCSILKKRKSHALSVGVCRVWGALNAISYCEKVERDPARGNRVVNYINVLFFVTQDLLFFIFRWWQLNFSLFLFNLLVFSRYHQVLCDYHLQPTHDGNRI